MPNLKNILLLSKRAEQERAAAFEAEMMALAAQKRAAAQSATPTASPPLPAAAAPARDGIQISVTRNGQTTRYDDLSTVPAPVRQQILNVWQPGRPAAPPPAETRPAVPPRFVPPPSARESGPARSYRTAAALNFFLPGAGLFYLGYRFVGTLYALTFLGSFLATLVIFLRGYLDYLQLSTSGDILEAGNLEHLAQAFHPGAMGLCMLLAMAVFLASVLHLSRVKSR